ncbi:MAG: sigma-70 family RNA polymerase sigma factor [Elusimicrobia bacterium]|nr:sigma-70 family RNA polymerase sigma factor [Elusimicrobiota bacterium]
METLSEQLAESDESLMRRFQAGDEDAFAALFDRYAAHLVNFAWRFLGNQNESEDLAQEALLRVYKSKSRYDPSRPFKPWIFSIAARIVSNSLRSKRRHPLLSLDQPPQANSGDTILNSAELSIVSSEFAEAFERNEAVEAVKKAIADLPQDQRIAVSLARFEDMSYEEIAEAMDTTLPAVKSLLFRARQNLKKFLS